MVVTDINFLRIKSKLIHLWNFRKVNKIIIPELLNYGMSRGLGLSAIQLGFTLRIFIMKLNNGEWIEIINPKIFNRYTGIISREGCLSLPGKSVDVHRKKYIEVGWVDGKRKKKHAIFKGLEAIIFQHEYDHLEGILIIDKKS